jgi:hypothetical protein
LELAGLLEDIVSLDQMLGNTDDANWLDGFCGVGIDRDPIRFGWTFASSDNLPTFRERTQVSMVGLAKVAGHSLGFCIEMTAQIRMRARRARARATAGRITLLEPLKDPDAEFSGFSARVQSKVSKEHLFIVSSPCADSTTSTTAQS